MNFFYSEKHATGEEKPPVYSSEIPKDVLLYWKCGRPVPLIRFEDTSYYFGFWGPQEIAVTQSKNTTDKHFESRTGSILAMVQE